MPSHSMTFSTASAHDPGGSVLRAERSDGCAVARASSLERAWLRCGVSSAKAWAILRLMRAITIGAVILGSSLYASGASADEWWGRDKALHGGVSFALAAAGYVGASPWLSRWEDRAAAGFAFSFSLGLAKEGYDLAGYGDPSAKDLTWDAGGAILGALACAALDVALDRDDEPKDRAAMGLAYSW